MSFGLAISSFGLAILLPLIGALLRESYADLTVMESDLRASEFLPLVT